MKIFLIYCLFVVNVFFILIFLILLFYKTWQIETTYTYIENFYDNKNNALIKDVQRNNCERIMMFYKVYSYSINSGVSEKIKDTCQNTIYYKDYLFYENIKHKNIQEAMKIYDDLLEKKDYKIIKKQNEMLAKIKYNNIENIDYTVDKNFNEMLFTALNVKNNVFISNY